MRKHVPVIIASVVSFLVGAGTLAALAAQTNYLGVVFVADPTTLTRQIAVNSDGSINVVCH